MAVDRLIDQIKETSYFQEKLAELQNNHQSAFGGMVGSAISAFIAALTKDFPNLLIITSSSEKAAALKIEIELLSGKNTVFFPAPDIVPGEEIAPSKEIIGERLAILHRWRKNEQLIAVAPVKAVMWRTSRGLEGIRLSEDQKIRRDQLIEELVGFGYKRFDIVGERGEFAVRGGIIDIFPLNLEHPVRLEFSGDEIESIRTFNAFTQRSIEKIAEIDILPAHEDFEAPLFEHLPHGTLVIFDEELEISKAVQGHLEEKTAIASNYQYLDHANIKQEAKAYAVVEFSSFARPGETASLARPESYINRFEAIPKNTIIISQHAARLREEIELPIIKGPLRAGFIFNERLVLSDKELFGEKHYFQAERPAVNEGVASELLADLKPGDFVVHENYGIGIFRGMESLEIEEGIKLDYITIEFAGEDKVYVPPSQAGMVEKYAGGGDFSPQLSRLGSRRWELTKGKVKKALKDMTKDLLEIYAARQRYAGFAFPPDDIWQAELEGTFPFEETTDQKRAIAETKNDMESGRPMDRLICGDVGYGKTEVAIRAAAKAAAAGKQTAVLVPTTILAEQHYNN
ncbi:MAG: CarD family transcriptional regulator, partial [Candidatus Margulisbacteria bacterium]|nr:CarD family transcriptional regulator [Candidatus Margulisiibacteriota bacterium]